MRTSLVVTAALASALGLVAPTAAAATPAPAAPGANPPLVYTTYAPSEVGLNATTVNTVGYDKSGRTRLASTQPGDGDGDVGTDVLGPAASWSPDHTRVAWVQEHWTSTSVSYAVQVLTRSTKKVASFPLPTGTRFASARSYLAWSADSTRIVLALVSGTTSTVTSLDRTTGTFTPVHALPADNEVLSIAVSTDGTIAYTSNTGVAVLAPGSSSAKSLYRVGTDEYCTSVRARPGAAHEFTYLCSRYGPTGKQVLRSQTPTGTARKLYTGDTSTTSTSPVTYLEGFAWSPAGTSLALVTTTDRTVDEASCTHAMTTTLATAKADGTGRTTLKTEPTITAQTCKGNGWGDVDTVVWSADGQTVVFLHATQFLGPQTAFAVRPDTPQKQTALAQGVVDLSS